MAKFWDEKLEGTGYQETWSQGETVGAGSILDEDFSTSSVTGAPSDWSIQCLRSKKITSENAYVRHDFASSHTISYARVEFIWASFPDAMNQFSLHDLIQMEDSAGAKVWEIVIQERGASNNGPYRIQFREDANGDDTFISHHSSSQTISLDTRYRIEVKWDGSANLWEFRFNGATAFSGSISGGSTNIQNDLRVGLGITNTGAGNAEIYYDNIAFDDTDWIGAENLPILRRRREFVGII